MSPSPPIEYIAPSISEVAEPFEAVLLDAYGVFWGGGAAGVLPGSHDAMQQLVGSGKTVGILSNSTQAAAKEIDKLAKHGLLKGTHYHFLLTSGEITRHHLSKEQLPFPTPRQSFLLFGGSHPKYSSPLSVFEGSAFEEVDDVQSADFIYVSIPHIDGEDQTDPELFRASVEAIVAHKLPMLCANPDRFAHEGKPARAVVRQGSIAALYEELGGSVFYMGKPHQIAYEAAMKIFGQLGRHDPSKILMVGDTPETDIRGAKGFGMPSALIVSTGIMGDRVSNQGLQASLGALPSSDQPTFLIQRLGSHEF